MNQCEYHCIGTWYLDTGFTAVLCIIEIQNCSIQMRTNTH